MKLVIKNKYEYKNIIDFFRAINQICHVSYSVSSYAFEDIENIFLLPKNYLCEKEKYFILKTKVDSMSEIFEDRKNVLEIQIFSANNGNIVVAFIYEKEEVTCKKYFEEDIRYELQDYQICQSYFLYT